MTDPNVAAASGAAIAQMGELGAEIKEISIPLHRDSGMIWMVALPMAGTTQGLLANPVGRKLLFPERATQVGPNSHRELSMPLGLEGRISISVAYSYKTVLVAPYMHAAPTSFASSMIHMRPRYGMSTIIFPPVKIAEEGGRTLGPLKMLMRTVGATYNTATFNSSGHPGLSLPAGFVPAQDDKEAWLPTGLQIMGKRFEDLTCLKIAGNWEKKHDWKSLKFGP